MTTEYRWLPHLDGAVPTAGQGKRISTYTVALEGWRRGLQLKFYSVFEDGNKLKVRYSLTNGNKTHHFSLSMGDKVSEKAFEICDDKELTKIYLDKFNVPVPKGEMFDITKTEQDIIEYGLSLGFPLVVKPTDGNAGRGVFANINSKEKLEEAVLYVRNELDFDNIIVENYVDGDEFRIYVIEDKVLGAMNRQPANVIGDGIHTIRELIHQKNSVRKLNPHLTSRLIKIDLEIENKLEELGYDLNSVPSSGEKVFLRQKSNLSQGGEAVDVTDELTEEVKEIAINAGKAIPGLSHYGVDMIVSDDRKQGVILEVNSRPGLGGHLFPGVGKPRDFAKEIIDFYFPETKNNYRTNLYFDFDNIIEALLRRSVSSIDVISPPTEPLVGKEYLINIQEEHAKDFKSYIRKYVLKYDLHGFTEDIGENEIRLVLVTINERNLKNIEKRISKYDNTTILDEKKWTKPLKMGFENKSETKVSKSELRKILNENIRLERENERLLKRYTRIEKSRFWKLTAPPRFILHNIKRIYRYIFKKEQTLKS